MVVRDPERAPDLPVADVAVASYDDPESLGRALEPGDRVFMVSMHLAYDSRLELHRAFIDEAVRQRVGHLVYLSFIGAGADASFSHARSHGATEEMLRNSGLPWSAVRNAMYGDEIASWFDPDGRITGSGGDGRISFSYRPELGKAIALLLADEAHDDRPLVTITTPDAVSLAGLASLASDLTGDDYRYEPLDREDWIAYRRSVGRPEWSIEAGITYYDGVARGEADVVSRDYEELTGTQALTVRELLELYRDALPLSRVAP